MLLTSHKLVQRKLIDIRLRHARHVAQASKVGVVSTIGYEETGSVTWSRASRLAAIVEPLLTVRRCITAGHFTRCYSTVGMIPVCRR
jgi:hypothetical protein